MDRRKIIIVGGGPAGLATALHLPPELAAETLIIEAETYPRPKLCGGGITVHGEEQLDRLGLSPEVQAFHVNQLEFRLGGRHFTIAYPDVMRIVDRAEFDAALAAAVRRRGIAIHSGERVLDLKHARGGITLTTEHAAYHAQAVVAADGAKSTVRRRLGLRDTPHVARLLRVMTPVMPHHEPLWQTRTAVFDFSCLASGVQGYAWDFPSYLNGAPMMNRGIFDSRILPGALRGDPTSLKDVFFRRMRGQSLEPDAVDLRGHPVRWFNPRGIFSVPRVLLTGDAAGVDPLFAEGISYAMEYGEVAAAALQQAFAWGHFGFEGYRRSLLNHRLGRLLRRRTWIAKAVYGYRAPRLYSLLWELAGYSPRRVQMAIGAFMALLPGNKADLLPNKPIRNVVGRRQFEKG